MKSIRTTTIAGLLFLLPFAVVMLVVGKVFGVMQQLAAPLDAMIPIDAVAGVAFVNILAVVGLLLLCYLAGLLATRGRARRLYQKIDAKLLDLFPRYSIVKSLTQSYGDQADDAFKPVLVRFDDLAQVALEVERGPRDTVTVFLPGSPDPWSGSVAQVTADRVDALATDFQPVIKSLRNFGRGSADLLAD
jgi:uncharacterized membrane protein